MASNNPFDSISNQENLDNFDGSRVEVVDPDSDQDIRRQEAPKYNVILWDDDAHTYEYVIVMMNRLFGYDDQKGYKIAHTVDTIGKAIVMTTSQEQAEFKRDQIRAFVHDEEFAGCLGSMFSTIERVN